MRSPLIALSLLCATPLLARAQTADGSCPQNTSPLKSVGEAATVAMPRSKVALFSERPILTYDEHLQNPVISFSIPLSQVEHQPLTTGQLARDIAKVEVPEPWSTTGKTDWKVRGKGDRARLEVSTPADESAWNQLPGELAVTLASGQLLIVEVSTPGVIGDFTATEKYRLRGALEVQRGQIDLLTGNRADYKAWIADPSRIPFSSQQALDMESAELARDQAAIQSRAPALQALLAAANPGERSIIWSMLADSLPPAEGAALGSLAKQAGAEANAVVTAGHRVDDAQSVYNAVATLNDPNLDKTYAQELADAQSAREKAQQAFQATRGEIEAYVKAHGLTDRELGQAEFVLDPAHGSAFTIAVRGRDFYSERVAELQAAAAKERAQKVAYARAQLPKIGPELSRVEAKIDSLEKELASKARKRSPSPATLYDPGCPVSTAAR